jgi:hypothetical protein
MRKVRKYCPITFPHLTCCIFVSLFENTDPITKTLKTPLSLATNKEESVDKFTRVYPKSELYIA